MGRRSSSRYRGPGNQRVVQFLSQVRPSCHASTSSHRCYPAGNMPRLRVLVPALIVFAVLAVVVTDLVITRVRARAQSDWIQTKNLTLAPAAKGLKEPTFVAI